MKKKWVRCTVYVFGALLILLMLAIFFSPYQKHNNESFRSVAVSVEINCPADSVFRYLGNSANAANWSAYVDHINPLNQDAHADGTVLSERRCFRSADEEGMTWDERVEEVVKNEKRLLSIYNMRDFFVSAKGSLLTEQRYRSIGTNRTRLTFNLYFRERPTAFDFLKLSLAAYKIASIFEKNLTNVKRICETGQ